MSLPELQCDLHGFPEKVMMTLSFFFVVTFSAYVHVHMYTYTFLNLGF